MHPTAYPFQIPLQHPADDGSVLNLPLQEGTGGKVYDLSVEGNDGTLYGPTWVPGRSGWALSFDRDNDYVDCGDSPSFDITSNLTVLFWVKRGATLGTYQELVNKFDTGDNNREWTTGFLADDTITFFITSDGEAGAGSTALNSNVAITDTNWHCVVCTYRFVTNGTSEMKIYIDGVLQNSLSNAKGPIYNDVEPVRIGTLFIGGVGARFLDGRIGGVEIYNRTLSATEIIRRYEETSP